MAEMSSHYPSFYSHHYEKCDGEEEEEMGTEVMVENRLIYFSLFLNHKN